MAEGEGGEMIVKVDSRHSAKSSAIYFVIESDRKRLRYVELPNGDGFVLKTEDIWFGCIHWSFCSQHELVLLTFHRGQRRVAVNPSSEDMTVQLLQYSAH